MRQRLRCFSASITFKRNKSENVKIFTTWKQWKRDGSSVKLDTSAAAQVDFYYYWKHLPIQPRHLTSRRPSSNFPSTVPAVKSVAAEHNSIHMLLLLQWVMLHFGIACRPHPEPRHATRDLVYIS